MRVTIQPDDEFNRALVHNVHPPDWVNPEPPGRYNLVVIGAGTAGLVTAAGAAGLGARVALVEKHLLGGDCLNVGCVPSKALIRASRACAQVRDAAAFGIRIKGDVDYDFGAAMARLRKLRALLSQNDSVHRFTKLGVDVFLGEGRFTGPDTVEVGGKTMRFAKAAICTGARAAAPPLLGLEQAGYLTNESVFSLTQLPRRLAVIGAGPIGCELAQAFARFGSQVTVLERMDRVLLREDPDAADLVNQAMVRDSVRFIFRAEVLQVLQHGAEKVLYHKVNGVIENLVADEILVGVGRAPNVEGLSLEAAGVLCDQDGIIVNDHLQTSNPRILAAGDVCSKYKFTHAADAMARIVIANALFWGWQKASALVIPWCTYTDPELAHVGLYEKEAKGQGLNVQTFTWKLDEVDRAVLDGEEKGFARVLVRKGTDKILGATIVAAHAGDMISEITLAMTNRLGLGDVVRTIHPYPTQAEVVKKLGDAYNRTRLTPFVKRILEKWLSRSRRG
jgi:pyruvate/2-oxoglutarate dehydrogenase complex dihydrolipoamide dehydrogenase (E3) component